MGHSKRLYLHPDRGFIFDLLSNLGEEALVKEVTLFVERNFKRLSPDHEVELVWGHLGNVYKDRGRWADVRDRMRFPLGTGSVQFRLTPGVIVKKYYYADFKTRPGVSRFEREDVL